MYRRHSMRPYACVHRWRATKMVRMSTDHTPEPQAQNLLFGVISAVVGAVAAVAIYNDQGSLRVPMWVAMLACSCFVLAGLALVLRDCVYAAAYRWTVVLLLLCMTIIPAWTSVASNNRGCRASLLFVETLTGCRLAFGVSTVLMMTVLLIAIRQTMRGSKA